MVLSCAEGLNIQTVAAKLGVKQATVSKWGHRFLEKRLEGLADEPRTEPDRTITDDIVEALVNRGAHRRVMASRAGHVIARLTLDLYPHLSDGADRAAARALQGRFSRFFPTHNGGVGQ